MKKIKVLDTHIANQIAAGEVVERPASVVKELVENAIDADASAITVEIQNGGLDSIYVSDDGTGIPPEDCLLAFERHATSKISAQEDLTHIETLGFRGEALASIAAVAQVELKTRLKGSEAGMHVRKEGGKDIFSRPAGCPEGTSFHVEYLFFNVPARRKFLKNPRTEGSYVGDFMARMVLMRPDISFRFISNDKPVYQSSGDGMLKHAVYAVYGSDILPHLKEIDYDDGYIKLSGYIGTPEAARPNRNQQSFFLNGRYIRSMQLSYALSRAYETYLMGKKYPFAILNIQVSLREVDVNVHPTKLEVRFAQEGRVLDTVARVCARALGQGVIPSVHLPKQSGAVPPLLQKIEQEVNESTNEILPQMPIGRSDDKTMTSPQTSISLDFGEMPGRAADSIRVKESSFQIPHYQITADTRQEGTSEQQSDHTEPLSGDAEEEQETYINDEQQSFGVLPLAIIGQAFDTYWIMQQGDALYMIDQHAAHERRLYERMMTADPKEASQALLAPIMMQLTSLECDLLMEYQDILEAIGFDIKPFSATSIRIFAIPAPLVGQDVQGMLRDALEMLRTQNKTSTLALKKEAIIQSACKHAIKAGDRITQEELQDIMQTFIDGGTPMTCPHGRPIIIKIGRKELEKMFKRIV